MIPAFLAAPLAKPLVKWGVIGGVLVASVLAIWLHGFFTCKRSMQREYAEVVAQQAAASAQQAVQAQDMESAIVQRIDVAERAIQQKAKVIRKKVRTYAQHTQTITISAPIVRMHDELRGLSEQAGPRLSTPDSRTRAPEIPRGGVDTPVTQFVPIEAPDGETVILTTEELLQVAVDTMEKYALMRNSYRGLSEWNDGRERLEKARHGMEEKP